MTAAIRNGATIRYTTGPLAGRIQKAVVVPGEEFPVVGEVDGEPERFDASTGFRFVVVDNTTGFDATAARTASDFGFREVR